MLQRNSTAFAVFRGSLQLPLLMRRQRNQRLLQVCLLVSLCAIVVSLLVTSLGSRVVYLALRAGWGPAEHWYDFSQPSLFVFYVYSAFVVDLGPRQHAIRLISISSPVELFARNHLDVLCVVRRRGHNTNMQVASILRPPPRHTTEPGKLAWFDVADYVYSCPIPPSPHNQHAPLELSVVYKTSQATEVSEATTFMPVEVPTRGHQAVAVCVQATYGHLSRERVVEWLEMQRLLGVSLIGVYLTPRTHRDTRRTLTRYAEATSPPLIELRTIGYLHGGRGKGHLLMVNLAAINDCVYRHSYTHRYIAVIDFDEVKSPAFARTKLSLSPLSQLNPRDDDIVL